MNHIKINLKHKLQIIIKPKRQSESHKNNKLKKLIRYDLKK